MGLSGCTFKKDIVLIYETQLKHFVESHVTSVSIITCIWIIVAGLMPQI